MHNYCYCYVGSKDFRFLARFADSAARLVANQDVGVGINRETLHALDKEYRLTLDTDRGTFSLIDRF